MTYAIIAVNILVFIFQISLSGQKVVVGTQVWNGMDAFTFQFGMISARFTDSAYAQTFRAVFPYSASALVTVFYRDVSAQRLATPDFESLGALDIRG